MATRVADKVALITGAGSGIGRATAKLLATEGAKVIVADIDQNAAQEVVNKIHDAKGKAQPVQLDVSKESEWQQAINNIVSEHQRLDILVNNAGISISKPVTDCTLDDWHKVMSVNVDGVFLGTKYAIQAMTQGGSIVNVASVSGIKPSGGAAAYCTSKAAIRMFSKTIAIECADAKLGIRVNVVSPGGVKTPMWEREAFFQAMINEHGSTEEAFTAMSGGLASHEFFTPEEVAATILYLASDESSHLTGTEIVLDRGHTG